MWQHMFSMPVMLTVWRRELTPPHSTHFPLPLHIYSFLSHMSRIKKTVKYTQENVGKGKAQPVTCKELQVLLYPFWTSASDRIGWSAIRSRRLNMLKEPRYPFLEVTMCAPGPIGTAMKKRKSFAPTWVRIPDRSFRSESLWGLRYPDPYSWRS